MSAVLPSARVTTRTTASGRPCQSSPPQLTFQRQITPTVSQGIRTVTSEQAVSSSYSRSVSPKGSLQTSFTSTFRQPAQTTYGNRSRVAVAGSTCSVTTPVKQEKVYAASPGSTQRPALPLYKPLQTSYGFPTLPENSVSPLTADGKDETRAGATRGLPLSVRSYHRSTRRSTSPYSRNRCIASTVRSQSPPPVRSHPEQRSVECKVLLTTGTHRCSLELAPETSVDEAISQATRQVLRNVVESRGELGPIGEHISVTPLPSEKGATTVGEWARRNLGHAPVVVVKSSENDCEAPRRVEVGQEEHLRHLQQEHSQMMASLQKLLQGQTETIERQAAFIDDLQEREQQASQLFCKTLARIKVDIASMKGDFLNFEEQMMVSENGQHN